MESQYLNTYHQARYRSIGLKRVSSTSESNSSPSSCIVSSPEQKFSYKNIYCEGEFFRKQKQGYVNNYTLKTRGQMVNITKTSIDSSDDEFIDVQDDSFDEKSSTLQQTETQMDIEESLVEGTDYDVIQVFAVDPDLDLEASDEDTCDEEEECIVNSCDNYEEANCEIYSSSSTKELPDSYIEVKPTSPAESVDKISCTYKPIADNTIPEANNKNDNDGSVNSSIIKDKIPESHPHIPGKVPNVDEFLIDPATVPAFSNMTGSNRKNSENSDLDIQAYSVLPNIEDIKRYLLEDIPYTKLKNVNRSLSVPQSPRHFSQIDYEESKTCLSFEDLNLNLSDLSFENDKHKNLEIDDMPHTLTDEDVNSFFNTEKTINEQDIINNDDDLSQQDMEIEKPIEAVFSIGNAIVNLPLQSDLCDGLKCDKNIKPTLLDYCKEKSEKETSQPLIKTNFKDEDFVDIESCNDTVIPVLEANNLNSLLEQFEATETLNIKTKPAVNEPKQTGVSNGVRLQEAGVQLNKNKMRHILMPTPNAISRRSSSPIHSDHDYCTIKPRRPSLPPLRKGQSLLKPEVLSSNSQILSSRKKPKRIVYFTSSDEECEKLNNKKININSVVNDAKNLRNRESCINQPYNEVGSNHTKEQDAKMSTIDKGNEFVIVHDAFKANDTVHSQNSKPRIKLIIKNKTVIIPNCDEDPIKHVGENKATSKSNGDNLINTIEISEQTSNIIQCNLTPLTKAHVCEQSIENIKTVDKIMNSDFVVSKDALCANNVKLEEKDVENIDNFYTELFTDKKDVKIPQNIQVETETPLQEHIIPKLENIPIEEPPKKKKLNIQEYKLRKSGNSNNSSTSVSPEPIFPEVTIPTEKIHTVPVHQTPPNTGIIKNELSISTPRKVYDPILEASRKILLQTKKQKALRKRDEDIVMSKIPKVEKLQLQPLMSDAEMLKMAGIVPKEFFTIPLVNEEKPKLSTAYNEVILVSTGTTIDEALLSEMEKEMKTVIKVKSPSSVSSFSDAKVQFTIKKNENILKHNIFSKQQNKKAENKICDDKTKDTVKIEFKRFKAIEATLKTMGKQVDTKKSNSLFSSIQDVVMKKAPESQHTNSKLDKECEKPKNLIKIRIVRDFEPNSEHGEDKVILHLEKSKDQPVASEVATQTDYTKEFPKLLVWENVVFVKTVNVEKDISVIKEAENCQDVNKDSNLKLCVKREKNTSKRKRLASNSRLDEKKTNSKQKRSLSREKPPNSNEKSSSTSNYSKEMTPPLKEMRSRSKENLRRNELKPKRLSSSSRKRSYSREKKLSQSKENRARSKEKSSRSYGRRSRSKSNFSRRRRSRSRSRSRRRHSRSRSRCRRRSRSYDRYRRRRRSSTSKRSRSHHRRSPKIKKSESRSCTPVESYPMKNEVVSPANDITVYRNSVNEIKSMTPPLRKPTVSESSNVSTSSTSSSSSSSSSSSATSESSSSSNTSASSNTSKLSNFSRASRSTKSCSPVRETPRRTRESSAPVEERRVVFIGKLEQGINKAKLRAKFVKFGPITEVRLHTKEDGTRYGFITFRCARDAWTVVEAASRFPEYDIGFGGRRAFCRQTYADLDGLEAEYTEHTYIIPPPIQTNNDLSFEEMLAEMKNKLQKRKGDGKP